MPGPNKVEEIKRQKDGLDVLADILRYAESGFESIQPDDFTRMRWYGIYQQKPNEGHFMLRLKLPNGDYQANQLREIGRIANEFGRGLADITTRQNFQFHWLRIEDIPIILQRLARVGVTTVGACGDVMRNIVGCPLAGLDGDEILDASPIVKQVSAFFCGNKDFSNLPRKYKISISGCRLHCAQPDINDIGLYGVERTVDGRREAGFGLKVGGGLSTKPYFGADLGVFVRPDEVFRVVYAITAIYRDSEVLRQDRSKARLKFLIHDPKIGVGPERFRAMLEERLGYRLQDGGPYEIPKHTELDHLGIRPQKQPGRWYVGIGVTVGRQSGDTLLRIADIAEEFSVHASLRNTNKQNFLITHVPEDRLGALKERLKAEGLDYEPSVFKKGLVSCTGIEFCNLAITETKEFGRRVAQALEERFPGASKQVRIHFSGCPNNCGQNAIADIGFRGGLTKVDGQQVEAYDMLVGGTTGAVRAFGEVCSRKVPKDRVIEHISNLYAAFLSWSRNGETFHDFVRAHTLEQLDAIAKGGAPQA
ncbi:MAG: hypothetical protein N2111_06425 [Candidatus Sumerlaeaceae bacterium]|nr:hypothetical protein [Candidatus Sumerlaeaceae bacterium]